MMVRRGRFLQTADAALEEGEADWDHNMKVKFIGEDAEDAGGPQREFFSLYFALSPCWDNDCFTAYSDLLQRNNYKLLGQAVAYASISGHPGPRCLAPAIVTYILDGTKPCVHPEDIVDAEVQSAISEVDEIYHLNIISVLINTSHEVIHIYVVIPCKLNQMFAGGHLRF